MYKYRRVIISVIALLLAAAILTGLLVTVFAANSADIRTEISGLESKQDELDQKKQELEAQIAANNTQTLNVVEQKAQIDQEIELTRQEVENLNEQIRQYNLLIAEKQAELDQLQCLLLRKGPVQYAQKLLIADGLHGGGIPGQSHGQQSLDFL